jgi:ssDNA-binding Zn-finger/Zn-ribbon topoisomerase 1
MPLGEALELASQLERSKRPRPPLPTGPGPCPYCEGPTVLRNGRRGKFYGCAGFPRCKGTRNYVEPPSDPRAQALFPPPLTTEELGNELSKLVGLPAYVYEGREQTEAEQLRAAIRAAGFQVMETSGQWSIHDVSQQALADERRTADVIHQNIDLEQAVAAAQRLSERVDDFVARQPETPELTQLRLANTEFKGFADQLIPRPTPEQTKTLFPSEGTT